MKTSGKELLEFVRKNSINCFSFCDGVYWASQEWLCGSLSGRSFAGKTYEDACDLMADYFDRHINHNSVVGHAVTASGWPNLDRVKEYLEVGDED